MPDTPTAYPPPQIVITYSGGRYHVDVATFPFQVEVSDVEHVCTIVRGWAKDVIREAAQ